MSLTKDKEAECKLVFDLYDSDNDGKISKKIVEKLVKGLGAYIPREECSDYLSDIDGDNINYEQFLTLFTKYFTKKMNKDELIEAFAFLDKGKTGKYDANDLKHSLKVFGDKLTDQEVNDLVGKYISGNTIDYKTFSAEVSK